MGGPLCPLADKRRRDPALIPMEPTMPTATELRPPFAARVTGIDIGRRLSPEDAARVRDALDQRAMLVFSQPSLTDDQQVAFTGFFGSLKTTRAGANGAHARLVDGPNEGNSGAWIERLMGFADSPDFVCAHRWWQGDVGGGTIVP